MVRKAQWKKFNSCRKPIATAIFLLKYVIQKMIFEITFKLCNVLCTVLKKPSSEKFFIAARKNFWQHSENNYFNEVAGFNNSLSQLNSFKSIHHTKTISV